MAVGVEPDLVEPAGALAGERVELDDALDLVAEHGEAPGAVLQVGREDLDRIALGAEGAAGEVELVAAVLQLDQGAQQPLALDLLALLQGQGHAGIGLGRADAVDAGHRGHDHDVVALEQGAGRRVAHAVDLLVDARGLLDVGVGARDVGFRLIVVVVADEILDGIVGEERLELAVELGRQDLVRRQHDRRPLHLGDDVRHGEGLARAGHAQQHLILLLPPQALDQIDDRLRLVAGRLELGNQLERTPALGPLDQIGIAGQRLEQVERGQAFDGMHGGLRGCAEHPRCVFGDAYSRAGVPGPPAGRVTPAPSSWNMACSVLRFLALCAGRLPLFPDLRSTRSAACYPQRGRTTPTETIETGAAIRLKQIGFMLAKLAPDA